MKKIVRLGSVILILFLLFYATKFVNECRQMQDVFNSFVIIKNPSSSQKCSLINETLQRNYDFLNFLDNPLPLWTDIGGHYVYSAFWNNESDKGRYALALGVGPPVGQFAYECSVWFDYQNIISSAHGKFSYSSSQWNSTVNTYNFLCTVNEEEVRGNPYMFVITSIREGSKRKHRIPIFHKSYLSAESSNKTAVCVRPDNVGIGKADIVEFISFHLLIGVTDLVLYGNEIHNSIIYRVRQLIGAKHFLRSLSTVPWNFPYDDKMLELKLIETDCAYRTFGLTKAYSILEWDQYIIPTTFKPILEVISTDNNEATYNINFQTQICCLEGLNDKRSEASWPVILKKTHCMNFPFSNIFKIHSKYMESSNEVTHNYSSVIYMKTYRTCETLKNAKTKYDHSPFKFLSGLLSSELLQLWNTGSLF